MTAVLWVFPSAAAASPNLALAANGGSATASSTWTYSGAPSTLIDGVVQSSGWWSDHPSGSKPAWAQVAWEDAQTLNRVVLRMPVIWGGASVGDRTFGELLLQYWDGDSWEAVDATGNPIQDWLIPTTDDGSQVKELEFTAITTTKIRVYYTEANAGGDAGLEEIQAYGP